MSDLDFGPALPPSMLKKSPLNNQIVKKDDKLETTDVIGPALPPQKLVSSTDFTKNVSPTDQDYNVDSESDRPIGPALPPGFVKPDVETRSKLSDDEKCSTEDSDDEFIGPVPPNLSQMPDNKSTVAYEFENRSANMKEKLSGINKPQKIEREEWMTELPPVLQGFGMGPRQFRAKPVEIGDRSGWTDTPSDKAKPKNKNSSLSLKEIYAKESDEKLQKKLLTQAENDGRKESLYSLHNKERKRKLKNDKDSENVRKPFDRDTDLNVQQFKKAVKKQKLKSDLSSRFSHGETSATFL